MVEARHIPVTADVPNEAGSKTASKAPVHSRRAPRIALYSEGMMGFGHIRRNASIAQALRRSALQPAIVMIAEAWQAGALLMPAGIDCVTLPALRKEANGEYNPRFLLDVSDAELIALRTQVIRSAMEVFEPDVLIVDYLPLGVAGELTSTLEHLRSRGNRSEEHTSELQSQSNLVCRLLLEKKKHSLTSSKHYSGHRASPPPLLPAALQHPSDLCLAHVSLPATQRHDLRRLHDTPIHVSIIT